MKLDFSGLKILVIGDPIYDEYFFGHADRISPEAPVPVFVQDELEERHGGAANVLQQLKAFGCAVHGGWWGIPNQLWTTKVRYMVGSHQLLRVDSDRSVTNIIPSLAGFHAIVISDYAKGACTPEICQEAIASGLPVIVDPKGSDWSKYAGCTAICPNDKEMQGSLFGIPHIIHKRGALGLRLYGKPNPHSGLENGRDFVDYPATSKKVFDVVGAGDCVVAVIAACIAKGIDVSIACQIANLAAGYTVGFVGTTVCPLDVLQGLVHDSGIG